MAGRPAFHIDDPKHNRFELRLNNAQAQLLADLADRCKLSRTETIAVALEVLAKQKGLDVAGYAERCEELQNKIAKAEKAVQKALDVLKE